MGGSLFLSLWSCRNPQNLISTFMKNYSYGFSALLCGYGVLHREKKWRKNERERNLIVLLCNKRSIKKWRGRSQPRFETVLFFLSSSRVIENAPPPPPLQDIKRTRFFERIFFLPSQHYVYESPIL